jgi:choline transport protein
MAVVIGLLNALGSLGALDSPCHLAEELQNPRKILPFALYIVIGSQVLVGIMWILVIGFCITGFETIINTKTGIG